MIREISLPILAAHGDRFYERLRCSFSGAVSDPLRENFSIWDGMENWSTARGFSLSEPTKRHS